LKVAVVGKGGVGKTTIAGVVARSFADAGRAVVALDCDTNPNLGIALGVSPAETARLASIRESLGDGGDHAPTPDEILDRFGATAPGGVRLAVVSRIDRPNPG